MVAKIKREGRERERDSRQREETGPPVGHREPEKVQRNEQHAAECVYTRCVCVCVSN